MEVRGCFLVCTAVPWLYLRCFANKKRNGVNERFLFDGQTQLYSYQSVLHSELERQIALTEYSTNLPGRPQVSLAASFHKQFTLDAGNSELRRDG